MTAQDQTGAAMPSYDDWYGPDRATFGDRVAGAREAVGLSQSELADRVGVRLKTLRAWEEDLAEPRANRLQMLSDVLDVSVGWLLTAQGDGLDRPFDAGDLPETVTHALAEMRQIRGELVRSAERLAVIEKRLQGHFAGRE